MKAQRLDIGFVGTGRMGRPMAQHVLAAGQRLYVCDVDPAAYAQLIDAGATPAATPAELAKKVQVVVTSLPEPAQVDAVAVGSDGLLRGARRGLLVIETSTIGPSQSRALARRFAGAGVDFVDAPVSGGVASAEAASLTAMVGGEKAQFDRALPVLRCFASRVIHMGPPGSGSMAKLINQMVYLSYVAAFCEAVALGRRADLNVLALLEVLRTSVAGSPLMTGWDKHIEAADLRPGFQINRVLKDLELGAQAQQEQGGESPVLSSVLRAFREAADLGYTDADMTALYAIRAGIANSVAD